MTDDLLVGCMIGKHSFQGPHSVMNALSPPPSSPPSPPPVAVLGHNLTNKMAFNSNLNPMARLSPGDLGRQVMFSINTAATGYWGSNSPGAKYRMLTCVWLCGSLSLVWRACILSIAERWLAWWWVMFLLFVFFPGIR